MSKGVAGQQQDILPQGMGHGPMPMPHGGGFNPGAGSKGGSGINNPQQAFQMYPQLQSPAWMTLTRPPNTPALPVYAPRPPAPVQPPGGQLPGSMPQPQGSQEDNTPSGIN